IEQIRENVLMMASMVERNVNMAMKALVERDDSMIGTVEAEETQINDLEVQLNEACLLFMAKQAPVATDLRFVLSVVKIAGDLERIGDQGLKIALRAGKLNQEPQLKPFVDIPRMAELGVEMLRSSMDAFVNRKPEIIQSIINKDEDVNALFRQLNRELTSFMIEDPRTITRCLHLMAVARHLEKVADHARNVARKVYFLYEAKDISHQTVIK
ncbi:MAG: phosphate signaling complex protein PhoU, partial [Verrucomicrobiae bacterium]|nr:phosphate signaling complex protein PhoU [Verrucomicrobiae bacterium]